MATYEVAVYSPSEITLVDTGGGNYQVIVDAGAVPTIITVTDTDVGANETIFNDGDPAVDGGAGWANPNQTFSGTIDGTSYSSDLINPEWQYSVDTGEGNIFGLYEGNGGPLIGYGFSFEPVPGTTYTFSTTNGTTVPAIILDDIFVCFSRGTEIETDTGARLIEDLAAGDMVMTKDAGLVPVKWIGSRVITATGRATPVRFKAGSFNNYSDLVVSQQHRMVVSGMKLEVITGEPDALVAAKHLTNLDTVYLDTSFDTIEYFHILFDRHEIIRANGAWSESFYLGEIAKGALDTAQAEEILHLFPELNLRNSAHQMALPELKGFEAAAITS